MATFDALHVPPTALEQGGVEVLRAAIVDGGLHVSLRRAFEDPEAWGMLIADVARHVARIYATEDKDGKPAYKLSVNDFVIKALALALQRIPDANVTWTEGGMLKHHHSDIGVAVAIS